MEKGRVNGQRRWRVHPGNKRGIQYGFGQGYDGGLHTTGEAIEIP